MIENKVFSLPDEKQLEGYATKAASRGEALLFWLLSLSDPSWTARSDFVYRCKPASHPTIAQLEAAAVAVARPRAPAS